MQFQSVTKSCLHKLVFVITLLLCYITAQAPLFCFSIPKAGTHLLLKCLQKMTGRKEFRIQGFTQLHISDYKKAGNAILKGHTVCNERNKQIFHSRESQAILIIRDPRDQIISQLHWMRKYKNIWSHYTQKSNKEILID